MGDVADRQIEEGKVKEPAFVEDRNALNEPT